jgi:hypothetical protein
MANDNIYILNAESGEEIVRAMTDEEQAARDAEVAAAALARAEKEAAKQALEAKKLEVLEKLGLTAEEAAALLA